MGLFVSHVNGVHRVILPKSRDPPTLKYFGVFTYVYNVYTIYDRDDDGWAH